MVRQPGIPTQTWQTFIRNHMAEIAAVDFFTVPTATLKTLHVFLVRHLRRVLKEYLAYYHGSRTHLGLEKDAPEPRAVQPQDIGPVASKPVLGGLHHRYCRDAA